jgi:flagellar motor switch protein FliN/FliY
VKATADLPDSSQNRRTVADGNTNRAPTDVDALGTPSPHIKESPVTAPAPAIYSTEALANGAAVLASALGVDARAVPIDEWPVDDGDAVVAATVEGATTLRIFLAVADADQLLGDPDGLAEVVVAAVREMTGDTSDLAVTALEATTDRPDVFIGLFAGDALTAALGISADGSPIDHDEIDALTAPGSAAVYEPVALQGGDRAGIAAPGPLELLNDVEMEVTVELGRTTMPIRELLALQPGTVVEIDRAAGAPIDVLVNGRRIASGEVVVIDEEFGVRITEIAPVGDR